MRWAEHVACKGERCAYRVLVRKPKGETSLERRRCRWEDNIKMDLREVEWGAMDWIILAQDLERWRAVVNSVMNFWVP
jgi:hypothetical protein